MAQNDRRTSYMSTNKPRVAASRAGESDSTARPRNESPLPGHMRGGTSSSSRGLSREYSSSNEKRIERTQTTTREKVQIRTRNPGKEPLNVASRGDSEKTRVKPVVQYEGENPIMRKKEKEPVEGTFG
jgi:gamma-tubulin complex component 2